MSFFGEIHTRKKARFYQWIFLLPLWMKLTWRELWSIRSNVLLTFRTIIKSYTMLILYSHTAQRYILWILIWQITHGDAGYKYIVVLLWTDLILKMSDIHTCLSVCLSFTYNLFYFVFSICLSKISLTFSLSFSSITTHTSKCRNLGVYVNWNKLLIHNYLWITKKETTPPPKKKTPKKFVI